MRRTALLLFVIAFLPLLSLQIINAQRMQPTGYASDNTIAIPAPNEVLGFTPGDDRKLASWKQIVEYFQKLDDASDRVKFETLGQSTMGRSFVMATITTPENLAKLEEYKIIQQLLADPRKLGAPRLRDTKAASLIKKGKTIVLITCGIHSTEVGSTLSSTLIAHRLASSNDPDIQQILQNTIILLVPSLNPDGVDIVKNWYDKTLGTPYEGTDPPELYHKYVGHDNNRDWYAFTQVETQITVDKIHNVWHPQIVHDIHQQGAFASRLFLPPYMPPVEPNVPKQLVEAYTELGNWMANEMRKAGFVGITTGTTYDAWTPARAYSHYHAGVRMLSETASARIATPITVKFEELRTREGYNPQKESEKFGPVWRGGEWRLKDITNYMTTAAFTLLKHAAQNREMWLTRFYEVGKQAVRPPAKGEVRGFIIPVQSRRGFIVPKSHEFTLISVLQRAGVEVDVLAKPLNYKGERFQELSGVVHLNQPYGSFARALLQNQRYPDLRDDKGDPIAPYDVTAHNLAALMGVRIVPFVETISYQRMKMRGLLGGGIENYQFRTALYKSAEPSMDEGWTRWVLEQERIRFNSLRDKDVRSGNLRSLYDAIIIPDQAPRTILNGHRAGVMPPEYTGGLGQEGVKALRDYVEQGGTVIFLNRASEFAIEQFKLPLRNVVAGMPRSKFYVPGSILRIELDSSHPIAMGLPEESIAWVEDSPVFEVTDAAQKVQVIARYPKQKHPLLSGWLLGGEQLKGKAALVEVTMGKGRMVLFGFRPQYRAQSLVTYPLLLNAIRMSDKL
ncbi:MAG TPA: M14 family zinc carboxypeptidase [Pyrinomonadaceae bacterium]|nr:M14 family zinc carboxypeptidase [Pyrinomonadaceae bacterium]